MRENAFCMVFHVRWISHHSSPNPTLVATRLGRDSETRGEKNPSHMENHTKCISSRLLSQFCNVHVRNFQFLRKCVCLGHRVVVPIWATPTANYQVHFVDLLSRYIDLLTRLRKRIRATPWNIYFDIADIVILECRWLRPSSNTAHRIRPTYW